VLFGSLGTSETRDIPLRYRCACRSSVPCTLPDLNAILLTASRIPICEQCFASFEPIANPVCQCGGRRFLTHTLSLMTPDNCFGAVSQTHCRLCREQFFAFHIARSYGAYNEALKKAILLLKFEEVTGLGDWFACRLAEVIAREAEMFRADVVVPVPLHPDRQWERGYSQAELIARPLARKLHLSLGAYLLMRTRPRPPRLVLYRKEHWDRFVARTPRARACELTSFAFY
jgi:predicted amidophosphoribosyltransferase